MEKSDKKIYRSKDNYILGGVSGGLSNYFGIDATLIRLFFILLTLWGGSGIFIYLVLWLIIPIEPGMKKEINRDEKVQEFATNIRDKANEIAQEIKIDTKKNKNNVNLFIGIILLLIGATALWNRFFPIEIRWDIMWPMIAILLGVFLIFKK